MEQLFAKELNLKYRGSRDYIYGPDLFSEALETLASYLQVTSFEKVDFSSHHMTREGLELHVFSSIQEKLEDTSNSKFTCISKEKKFYGYLLSTGQEVVERTPYPEEEIIKQSTLNADQKEIVLNGTTSFKLTDNYTALNKMMHNTLYPGLGKWIFVRVVYERYSIQNTFNTLKVRIRKNFANKYTQSILQMDEQKVGTLYFSII